MVESKDERLVEVAVARYWSTGESGEWYLTYVVVDSELSLEEAWVAGESIAAERESDGDKNFAFAKTIAVWNDDMMDMYWSDLDDWDEDE